MLNLSSPGYPISFEVLASLLCQMPCLQTLLLSMRRAHSSAVARPVRPQCKLKVLSLKGTDTTEFEWILSRSSTSLHTLQVSHAFLKKDSPQLSSLMNSLEQSSGCLRRLHLWLCPLEHSTVEDILTACPALEELGLPFIDEHFILGVRRLLEDTSTFTKGLPRLRHLRFIYHSPRRCATNWAYQTMKAAFSSLRSSMMLETITLDVLNEPCAPEQFHPFTAQFSQAGRCACPGRQPSGIAFRMCYSSSLYVECDK